MSSFWIVEKKLKDGSTVYYVKARLGGRGTKEQIIARATSKAEANRLKREASLAAQEKRAGVFVERATVREVLKAYEEMLGERPQAEKVEQVTRLHLQSILDLGIEELKTGDLQDLVEEKLEAGYSEQQVHHIIGVVGTAWRRAAKAKGTDDLLAGKACPVDEVELPSLVERIKDTLSVAELEATLPHLEEPWSDAAGVAAWLFLRPGELFSLQRTDVDLLRRAVYVRRSWEAQRTKTKLERVVPIYVAAVPYLERALERSARIGGNLVFPTQAGTMMPRTKDSKVSRRLRTAMVAAAAAGTPTLATHWELKCRRALSPGVHCGYATTVEALPPELPRCPKCAMRLWPVGHARPLRWYDLRHTGATVMIEMGVPIEVVSKMLGHTDIRTTMRHYVNVSTKRMLAELDRVAGEQAEKSAKSGAAPVLHRERKLG